MSELRGLPPEILEMLMRGGVDPFEQFKRRAEDAWEKGKNETEPNAEFHFLFRQHVSVEDTKTTAQRLADYDVFIPEAIGWDKDKLQVLRDLSAGKLSVDNVLAQIQCFPGNPVYERRKAELQNLYGTNKAVAHIDVQGVDPLYDRMEAAKNQYMLRHIINGTFEDAVKQTDQAIRGFAQTEREREEIILRQLPLAMKEVVASYPELKNKSKLKVLIEYGIAHSPLYYKTKTAGKEATREFAVNMPLVYHFREEGLRRVMYGKEMGQDFIVKVIMENLLYRNIKNLQQLLGADRLEKLDVRKAVDAFNTEEIKSYFDLAKQDGLAFTKAVVSVLEQKGII